MGGAVFFQVTWLQYVPVPSGTDTPPGVVYGELHTGEQTRRVGGIQMRKKVTYLRGKMLPEIKYLCQKETGAIV